jgi:hypothetical protein
MQLKEKFNGRSFHHHNGFADLPEGVGVYVMEIDQPSLNSVDLTSRISAKALTMVYVIGRCLRPLLFVASPRFVCGLFTAIHNAYFAVAN